MKLLLLAFCLGVSLLSAAPLVWNKSNNFDAWRSFSNAQGKKIDGKIVLTNIRFDSQIFSRLLSIDPRQYDTFTFTYRAENGAGKRGGQLFFKHKGENFHGSRQWNTPALIADGKWHTVTVKPKNLTSWLKGGNITGLRFDPTDAPGGKIEISEIRLEKSGAAAPQVKAAPPEKSAVPPLVWNKTNNFGAKKYFYKVKGKVVNGILELTDLRVDCMYFINDVDIDPRHYNTLTFTYQAKGTGKHGGQFYFRNSKQSFRDSRKWNIPKLIPDGKWHTVSITPPDLKPWLDCGRITALRFDPTDSAGGTIKISEVKLEKRAVAAPAPVNKKVRRSAPAPRRKQTVVSPLDAPVWKAVKSEIWSRENRKRTTPYFTGKMVVSPEDTLRNKKFQEFYLRRTFNLKAKPVHGWLQYTADDCSQAFVNGSSAGYSNDWRTCVTLDVTRFLRKGQNVLAFHYINPETWGGVIAELYVQYADGSCERIVSDKHFRSSSKLVKNWNKLGFDDKKWLGVIEQDPPPAKPWRIYLPYRYFENMQKVVSATVTPSKVTAGKAARFKILCEGKMPSSAIKATLLLNKGRKVVWRETITIDKKYFRPAGKGRWYLDFPYTTPLYFSSGKYNITFESDMLSCQSSTLANFAINLERIKTDPSITPVKSFRVVKKTATPYFELNGKPFWPTWISGRGATDADVNVVTVSPNNEMWWNSVDKPLDFSVFDTKAEEMRRKFPNAYFMWNLHVSPPFDWPEHFPKEMCHDEFGKMNRKGRCNFSYSSEVAKKQFSDVVARVIRYLESSPYAQRIIGYRIVGGTTIEWLGWEPQGKGALDFADCSKKAFAAFAKANYPHLKDVSIPKRAERLKSDGASLLWDQKKHSRAIAYNDFTSHAAADAMLTFCRLAKKMVGDRKVVGTYYGYTSTLHHTGVSQFRAHYALKKVLEAKTLDFIMSPNSYPLRYLGDTDGDMKPYGTLQKHGIIPTCEKDTRTHNSYDVMHTAGSRTQLVTEKQTIHIIRRNMGIDIARGKPNYFLPLAAGTEIDFPAMAKDIDLMKVVTTHLAGKITRKAETALVVSETAIKNMPVIRQHVYSGITDQFYKADGSLQLVPRRKAALTYETFVGNQGRFNRSGAPIDQLLAEDLADNPGNYKLYVFLNCYNFDEKFLKAVEKLRQRPCVLLWLYAPGYHKGLTSSTANMKRLTGIDFEKLPGTIAAAAKMKNGRLVGSPYAKVTPMFAVTTPSAQVLGRYANGKAAIAAVRTGKALSIFSGPWQLPLPFIKEVMDRAGVFRYVNAEDPFEANDSFAVLHARYAGTKHIRLPKKTTILDIYGRKIIGRNTDRFSCTVGLHETKCFYFGSDADQILKKLQKNK